MKKFLLTGLSLFLFSSPAFSETNIRNVLDSSNILLKNNIEYIDKVNGSSSEMLIYSLNLLDKNIKGLRLRIKGRMGNSLRFTSYITDNEISKLIKALNEMISIAEKNKNNEVQVEINYRTIDGVNFAYYQEGRDPKFYIESGVVEGYSTDPVGVSKYTTTAAVEFDDINELKKIKNILEKIK